MNTNGNLAANKVSLFANCNANNTADEYLQFNESVYINLVLCVHSRIIKRLKRQDEDMAVVLNTLRNIGINIDERHHANEALNYIFIGSESGKKSNMKNQTYYVR